MATISRCASGSLALLVAFLFSADARAQDPVLAELYGRGVHNYFSGRMDRTIADMSSAINRGSKDPRVYYYRALAEMRAGNSGMAESDMRRGAQLELTDSSQYYAIGKSLERVQGSTRATLERYRSQARADAGQVSRASGVMPAPAVRPPASAPARTPARPPAARPAPVVPAVPPPPARDEEEPAPARPVDQDEMPAPARPADTDDPFGDPPTRRPAPPDTEDPFKD